MDTKELLSKIAKLKSAIEIETDADVISAYKKKVDSLEKQIAEAEVKVEKVEAKAAAEEKKELSEAEVKIKKLKSAIEVETDPDVKERYQKKIKQLEETLKDVKQEIKEEKKEIAEQKKDIKQATKEVKSAQKEVRKTAIKKVAAKQVERKQVVTRKAKRKTKIKSIISDLDKLINKNKELKAKYKDKGVDLKKDASRSAKPFGYRFVGKYDYRVPTEAQVRKGLKRGTIDYEARPNRSDVYPKADAKLADGGMMARGGRTKAEITADKRYKALKAGKRVSEDGNVYYESRANRSDVSRRDKLEDGGMMAKGGYVGETVATVGESVVTKGGSGNYWAIVIGNGKIFLKKSFKTKQEAVKFLKESDKMADGGMMKKGGKVGSSQQDKSRYAKPAGWRWKDEAVTKRVIERKQLSMQPSKKMRDKYPDLVYFEDRLNKADKKPTRSSADSI